MESEKLTCPECHTTLTPDDCRLSSGGLYSVVCQHCGHSFRFRAKVTPKSSVEFMLNGVKQAVTCSFEATITLNEYIRDIAHLPGTKVMCHQGGCGCCVVMATHWDPVTQKTSSHAVNSCLTPVYGCDGWEIITTEGVGSKGCGYDAVQQRIADYNGSQCGYCTPGMVMSAYSYLQEQPHPTKQEIGGILDGNICRCTGYRPILDAVQSFSKHAKSDTVDIEDLSTFKKCCKIDQRGPGSISKDHQMSPLIIYSPGARWYRPTTLAELYALLDKNKGQNVKLVVGNTSLGFSGDDSTYKIFIDTKAIEELYETQSNPLTFGANLTLTHLITKLQEASVNEGYTYCSVLTKHLKKVASTPIRNVASWAGNLALKHNFPSFASDIFLLLETVGGKLTVGSKTGKKTCSPLEFLQLDLSENAIVKVTLPQMDKSCVMRTFKIMPRSQNALAYVNAGFCLRVDASLKVLAQPSIVYGGISPTFVHAYKTEHYLTGKVLSDVTVLQAALSCLKSEIQPEFLPEAATATYRQHLAIALFYKFLLGVCGDGVAPRLRSGGLDIERPLSTGIEDYNTDKTKWPLTEPMPKLTARQQASGEAEYTTDIPPSPRQLYGAFVLATVGNAMVKDVDATEAMLMRGVEKVMTARDIPEGGVNNCIPDIPGMEPEEIFSSGPVLYAGQSIGLVLADTQRHADLASRKVKVTYTEIKPPITDLRGAIQAKSFFPNPGGNLLVGDPDGAIKQSGHVLTGEVTMGSQYHFTMETQGCVCVPKDTGLEMYPGAQWIDLNQSAAARACGLRENQVHVSAKRVGGAYGSKATRSLVISSAAAVAATVTNRPVSIHLDLESNMKMIGRRVSYLAQYKVGFDNTGKLHGLDITYYADCGCSINDQTVSSLQIFADNCYFCHNWKITVVAVKTNTPSTTWARAPGSTPTIFIIESIMEHIAEELGVDPTLIKQINLYKEGQMTPIGQSLLNCNISELLNELLQSAKYKQRVDEVNKFNQANRWKKRGLSVVPMKFPAQYSIDSAYNVTVTVCSGDGSVSIVHGGIEVGQGINTKAIQVCAYELGLPVSMVTVRPTDTLMSNNSGYTGGSTTSELCCLGVIKCCEILEKRLAPVKEKMHSPTWQQLIQQAFMDGVNLTIQYWVRPDPQRPTFATYYTYGVTCTEVEIDVLTGENITRRVDMLYDLGQSMNPEVDMGQAQGAFVMGMGYFTTEEIKYDPQTGENVTNSTWTYHPPTTNDIPTDFRIKFNQNNPNPKGVLGSKIVGEPPLCMSSSVFFALKHAITPARQEQGINGHWLLDAPATVERIQGACVPDISQYTYTA